MHELRRGGSTILRAADGAECLQALADDSGGVRTVASLPHELERDTGRERLAALLREYEPVGVVERALVEDLARQIAVMTRWGKAAEAVERLAATHLTDWSHTEEQSDMEDLQFAAISSDNAERCERQSLLNSRAFQRTYHLLQELQERRRTRERAADGRPPVLFRDEATCEQYLADRFKRGRNACRKCGSREGCYLEERRVWECRGCQSQTGLRTGTLMARSQLALWHWFSAISWMLFRPSISARELALKVGLERPATVRSLMQKIRAAMAAEDASEQLAGLDLHFAAARPHLRQASSAGEVSEEPSTGLQSAQLA